MTIAMTEETQVLLDNEPMLRWFEFDHLPEHLKDFSRPFYVLAVQLVLKIERSPERTVALRKLLESKDAAVRAALPTKK